MMVLTTFWWMIDDCEEIISLLDIYYQIGVYTNKIMALINGKCKIYALNPNCI